MYWWRTSYNVLFADILLEGKPCVLCRSYVIGQYWRIIYWIYVTGYSLLEILCIGEHFIEFVLLGLLVGNALVLEEVSYWRSMCLQSFFFKWALPSVLMLLWLTVGVSMFTQKLQRRKAQ